MPRVSVITSVFNGEAYLEECVDSILNQTFKDFEYIILNNGSTDRTPEILDGYTDSRIRIVHQENIGIARSLNKGVELSNGDLILRLDADDYSIPQRLEKQLIFMDRHPEIVLCGSRFKVLLGNETFDQPIHFIEENAVIRKSMGCFNPFAHSTVIYRKKAFIESGGYNKKFKYSQDYDLWLRMLECGEAHILKDILSTIRFSAQSESNENRKAMKLEGLRIRWNALRKFGGNPMHFSYYYLKSLFGLLLSSKNYLNW
jgi:cellulose synthase/poly-beta-1,6-N-acetylglucosamine synthase-like glycosyltransferase